MFNAARTFIKPEMKVYNLIEENHNLLLMLQHFEIDFRVDDMTLSQLCQKEDISLGLFVAVANLYNGYMPKENPIETLDDLREIVKFLRNSHTYYREDKYPQMKDYIHQLQEHNPGSKELELLEKFFNEYFDEVMDHFDYEDNIAFPYFIELFSNKAADNKKVYSANVYKEHHTDIELKLKDLKSLLLKHLPIGSDLTLRRKLLFSLFELEFDLYIHSLIEETILIPFGYKMEVKV